MNIFTRIIFQWRAQKIMGNFIARLSGYKTYILAVAGILVALIGHFWGPVHVGPIDIPQISWGEFWTITWNSGLFSFLRMGVKKTQVAAEVTLTAK